MQNFLKISISPQSIKIVFLALEPEVLHLYFSIYYW